ncbi:cathepsin l1 [Anaeramoeba flamelloides]|uniref:Cathepsin l1 n=1 Tax=Anaeramoeba flamelloides TaxID=1746091 RepID=A0AAV8A0T2_9EUKA|nr:cathepsin l1 [Anaeramoeba flamelloides]
MNFNQFFICFLVFTTVFSLHHELEWKNFQNKFNKNYKTQQEHDYRKRIFLKHLKGIEEHNSDPTKTWTKGIRESMDLTDKEWDEKYKCEDVSKNFKNLKVSYDDSDELIDVSAPSELNYNDIATTPRNRRECGSSWASSTNALFEYKLYELTNTIFFLSEQQIIDCTYNNSCVSNEDGCQGENSTCMLEQLIWNYKNYRNGQVRYDCALAYNRNFRGSVSWEAYPYLSKATPCETSQDEIIQLNPDHSLYKLSPIDEETTKKRLAKFGYIGVGYVYNRDFEYYSGGVLNAKSCVSTAVDKAGVIVGYGWYFDLAYWRLRINEGPTWGESGNVLVGRGHDVYEDVEMPYGMCNIRQYQFQVREATLLDDTIVKPLSQPQISLTAIDETHWKVEWLPIERATSYRAQYFYTNANAGYEADTIECNDEICSFKGEYNSTYVSVRVRAIEKVDGYRHILSHWTDLEGLEPIADDDPVDSGWTTKDILTYAAMAAGVLFVICILSLFFASKKKHGTFCGVFCESKRKEED